MNINNDHDALAGKRRFVQSLTRSRARFLNDADFLKPITSNVTEDTSNTPQPNYNTQSTLFFDHGTKETSSLHVFTHHLCERCTYAIAKANGTNDYQFVLCAKRLQAFPTSHQCTSFKLDEQASKWRYRWQSLNVSLCIENQYLGSDNGNHLRHGPSSIGYATNQIAN